MMSIALAKKVHTKGRESVTISPWYSSSTKNSITERKNKTQYKAVFFFAVAIVSNISAKIRQKIM